MAEDEGEEEEAEEELGGLFRVSRPDKESKRKADALDCSKFPVENPHDWDLDEVLFPAIHFSVFKTTCWSVLLSWGHRLWLADSFKHVYRRERIKMHPCPSQLPRGEVETVDFSSGAGSWECPTSPANLRSSSAPPEAVDQTSGEKEVIAGVWERRTCNTSWKRWGHWQ